MSVVTNVILKTFVFEEKAIDILNAIFQSGQEFISCDDISMPRGWYAGGKMLECGIYPGAFNHLDLDQLVRAIKSAPWRHPDAVQLFIQDQEEDRFVEIDLKLEEL